MKNKEFVLFTAADFIELRGPGQGGPRQDVWARFKLEIAVLVAQQANHLLNERGKRVFLNVCREQCCRRLDLLAAANEIKATHDETDTHEALLIAERPIGEKDE